ncbi:MAG TPA: 5-formyltetrahydrofolate cyclo-ligase, partial [Stellaceae bacterium]|nr:5-formyltetrahydrofolate cyclo-ligase [Stellaceae bacterium]
EDGRHGIPVPPAGVVTHPGIVVIPVVGFDAGNYRLGYGGGYFDRSLAVAESRPLSIGVGFELARLPTIFPRPHDVPMDLIVTEAGVQRRASGVSYVRRRGTTALDIPMPAAYLTI